MLDPTIVQLGRFYENLLLHFDLGTSRRIQNSVPVTTVIGGKFKISMKIGLLALSIALVLGVLMSWTVTAPAWPRRKFTVPDRREWFVRGDLFVGGAGRRYGFFSEMGGERGERGSVFAPFLI